MKRLTLTLGLLALAAVLAACSGASAAPETTQPPAGGTAQPATGGTGDAVTVVAKDIAFQTTDVAVKAGAPVTIDFDNQDGAPTTSPSPTPAARRCSRATSSRTRRWPTAFQPSQPARTTSSAKSIPT